MPQSLAVCLVILLTKPHVTHKTVYITAYRFTDLNMDIRCGQNGVQQIVVSCRINSVHVTSFKTTQQVWLITLWGAGVGGQNGPWLVATVRYG